MMKPTKAQAKAYLQEALDGIPALGHLRLDSTEFVKWRRDTWITVRNIFGKDSIQVKEFASVKYSAVKNQPMMWNPEWQGYRRGLDKASGILESLVEEVDRWWLDDVQAPPAVEIPNVNEVPVSNRVFVVHGRDEASKQMVARYLEGLGLEPVILQEQPSQGRTIIEKFEDYAQTVGFAVVIVTPDDVGGLADEPDNLQPRMRQNVVLELGYFAAALGRKRVCVLLKGDVERPSDYDGVIYITMNDGEGWKLTLGRELRAAGFDVDLNKL